MKIRAEELKEQMDQGQGKLLDVRTPAEFDEIHIEGSELMPLDRLDAYKIRESDESWIIVCGTGKRAERAKNQLEAAGCENLKLLEGGVTAWELAGYPVKRGKSAISLERQVRIAAGVMILLGLSLGAWLNPAFYGISGFVGAGLIFAGITDWCGMGLLLARAPWNQRRVPKCSSESV